MDILAISLRFATYAVLSLVAGMPLFLWAVLGAVRGGNILSQLRLPYVALLAAGALLAICTLICTTATMTGSSLLPIDWSMVGFLLSGTAAGKAIMVRCIALVILIPVALRPCLRSTAMAAAVAAATLAWGGHAVASEGLAGWLHLSADIAHIVAAAAWIGGMACLLWSLQSREKAVTLPMLRAFAMIGTITVGTLVATGLVNGLMILGPTALPTALGTLYGRLLAVKLLLFVAMLGLAANNRFRLTPAFEGKDDFGRPDLLRSIGTEMLFALVILALVGWFGMIDPTAPV